MTNTQTGRHPTSSNATETIQHGESVGGDRSNPISARLNRFMHPSSGRTYLRVLAVPFLLCILCTACNAQDDENGIGNSDTDTALEAIVESGTDRRNIPVACQTAEDCDDRDPCTIQVCARGQCAFRHEFSPMYIEPFQVTAPVTSASIIGNRVQVAVNGSQPAVQTFNVPNMDLSQMSIRHTSNLRYGAAGLDATWGGFIAVQGAGGMEVFSSDNLDAAAQITNVDSGVLEQLDIISGVSISNSNVWIAGYEEGVTLLAGDINGLTRVGTVDTVGRAVAIAARGENALVADSLGGAVGVYMAEGVPTAGAIVETSGRVVDVDANGSSGIIAEYGAGFSLVDLSRINDPKRLSRVETDSAVVAVRMIGRQTALVFTEAGEMMRVGFLDYTSPRLMESVQLPGIPIPHGVDFYNAMGVITYTNGTMSLVHNGCNYE